MDRADEIVPGMAGSQFRDPILVSRDVVNFEAEPDFQFRKLALSFADLLDIFVQLIESHAPVIEIVPVHWAVIGHANLAQPHLDGVRGVFDRFSDGMTAKRSVHVVVRR